MTFRAYPVSVTLRGQKWSASYCVREDSTVCVDSAYGYRTAKAAKNIKQQAERLLGEIVEERFGDSR